MGAIFELLSLEAQRRPFLLRNVLGTMRRWAPVSKFGKIVFALSAAAVDEAYGRPQDFVNGPVYAPKLKLGPMILGLDPSVAYTAQRRLLYGIVGDNQATTSRFAVLVCERARARQEAIESACEGKDVLRLDLVTDFIEPVLTGALCQLMGLEFDDAADLLTSASVTPQLPAYSASRIAPNARDVETSVATVTQWLRKLGGSFAASWPAPFGLEEVNEALAKEMKSFLEAAVPKARGDSVIGELRDRRASTDEIVRWVGGMMLAGAALFKASTIAIQELSARPAEHDLAQKHADQGEIDAVAGFVWEALRFHPLFPMVARYCPRPTRLGAVQIDADATVVLATLSAMFDPARVQNPEDFDPLRPERVYLLFGGGPHRCLAETLARVAVPEIVAHVLSAFQIEKSEVPVYDGTAVHQYEVRLKFRPAGVRHDANRTYNTVPPVLDEPREETGRTGGPSSRAHA